MPIGMEEGANKKRYVPIPRRTKARSMTVGTWRNNYPMAMGIQRTGVKLMVVGLRCLGDNPDIKTAHSYKWKQKKMQQMRIRLIAIGTYRTNFGLRAKANRSYPRAWGRHYRLVKVWKLPAHSGWTSIWWLCCNERQCRGLLLSNR